MEICGRVTKRPFAVGSKSEREAVYLVADDRECVLQRQGGNPFRDEVLERLVGKMIRCQGIEHGYKFIMTDWQELD